MSMLSPQQEQRVFLPEEFRITVWSKLKPYYNDLLKRPIRSSKDLRKWLLDKNELNATVHWEFEERKKAYQQNPKDSRTESYYHYMLREILPKIVAFERGLSLRGKQIPKGLKVKDFEVASLGVSKQFSQLI